MAAEEEQDFGMNRRNPEEEAMRREKGAKG